MFRIKFRALLAKIVGKFPPSAHGPKLAKFRPAFRSMLLKEDEKQTFRSEKEVLKYAPPPSGSKPVILMHETEPGFGVRIMPERKNRTPALKMWIVRVGQYREKIGPVGVLTMREASEAAAQMRLRRRKSLRAGIAINATFQTAFESFAAENAPEWSPQTLENYRKRAIELGATWAEGASAPTGGTPGSIWTRRLDRLTNQDLIDLFEEIKKRASKTNVARKVAGDGSSTAAGVARFVHAVLKHAVDKQLALTNVMSGLKKRYMRPGEQRTTAVPREDFPKFWSWLLTHAHPAARDYILIALFLALRRSVLGSLRWSQLQARTRVLVVPAEAKGNKRHEMFAHPIPDFLFELVFKPRLEDPNRHPVWIIPSNKRADQPLRSVRTLLRDSLLKRTGIKISDHAMRRTSSTLLYAATKDWLITKRLLTHQMQAAIDRESAAAGYVNTSTDEMRDAMNKMCDFALEIVAQAPEAMTGYDEAEAEVVEFEDDVLEADEDEAVDSHADE